MVNAVAMIGLAVPVPVPSVPPLDDTQSASKCVTALPPLLAGVNATDAAVFPRLPTTAVGALGVVAGTTRFEGTEAGPVPMTLVAVTVHV